MVTVRSSKPVVVLLLLFVITACQGVAAPDVLPTATITATPTVLPTPTLMPTPTKRPLDCSDLDAAWGKDWAATLRVLDVLIASSQRCGEEPLLSKYYAAHINYAVALEQNKQLDAAIEHYRAALMIDSRRREALNALVRLKALPEPTPPACPTGAPPKQDPAPRETAKRASFVAIKNNRLVLDGKPFQVKGVNYYPRHASWRRFLQDADPSEMAAELRLIKQAGFNTLRIFLWYEALFICAPEDAIPNQSSFAKLDALFALARQQNLKLIVTLNDLPDMVYRPLYIDWAHYDAQTTFIVRRYRNESSILAWDLRNEGDLDWAAPMPNDTRLQFSDILGWLAHTSALVRKNDPSHLLTAGWSGDPTATGPYVDFLSFHHWTDAGRLRARVLDYRQRSKKPLLLEEVGYHSWDQAPQDARDEATQAKLLSDAVTTAEKLGLLGWVAWDAFDFVPPAGRPDDAEYFFGLWRTDLTPKPALKGLPLR
jgi:hypothetical protein